MSKLLLLLSALTLGLGSLTARADVSVEVFYDSLEPYGQWVEVGDYGYCWAPREVGSDWRPYTDGEWVYTDAGWTWVSEEPYGWAVYHYGRWLRTEDIGWVWVPGEEWGPAWVSWRRSPEYVGWAPLPPEARFSASVGFSRDVDVQFDIGPAYYSFVSVRHLGAQRLRSVIIEPRRNVTIIRETRNITNITYVNQTVINRGPDYAEISGVSERPIRKLKLDRRTDFAGSDSDIQGSAKITEDTLFLPAPRVEKKADAKPRKVAKKIAQEKVRRGWEDAGSPEEVKELRAGMSKEKAEPAPAGAEKEPAPATDTKEKPPQPASEMDPAKAPVAPRKTKREQAEPPATPAPDSKPAPEKAKPRKKGIPENSVEKRVPSPAPDLPVDPPRKLKQKKVPPEKGEPQPSVPAPDLPVEPPRKQKQKKALPEKGEPQPSVPAPEVRRNRPEPEPQSENPVPPRREKAKAKQAKPAPPEKISPAPEAPKPRKEVEVAPAPAPANPPPAEEGAADQGKRKGKAKKEQE